MNSGEQDQWYVKAFGDLYPLVYTHRDEEAASKEVLSLVSALGLENGSAVLDLCCGGGRHSQALASLNYRLFGLDLSLPLLNQAKTKISIQGKLVQSDMRFLPFKQSFDLVLNLFSSFGYFDDKDNEMTLRGIRQCLKFKGRLVLDHINRDKVVKTLVPADTSQRNGVKINQRRWIDGNRVLKKVEVVYPDGSNDTYVENVRMYHPEEMVELLNSNGYSMVELWGTYLGGKFNSNSDRMIVLATAG